MDDVSMIVEDLREPILKIKKLQEESLSIVISDIDFIIKNNVKDKNKIENLLDKLLNIGMLVDVDDVYYKFLDYYKTINKYNAEEYRKYYLDLCKEKSENERDRS